MKRDLQTRTKAENHLIELLPGVDRRALLSVCEPVELALSEVLVESGKGTRYAYFPVDATISLVTPIDGKPVLEVGMVGREGMVGAQLVLGVMKAPLHAVVQGAGKAWRIRAGAFRRELARSPALRRCLNRYLYVLMTQLGVSAACLRFHLISPRLARWLLMTQDRAHSDTFHVTHEFLAYMLGVRRVGITTAASTLQRAGLIEYRRGKLLVLNRPGLEAAACGCYAADRLSYAELLR
jgi:CRP-like cAMP-binding protein